MHASLNLSGNYSAPKVLSSSLENDINISQSKASKVICNHNTVSSVIDENSLNKRFFCDLERRRQLHPSSPCGTNGIGIQKSNNCVQDNTVNSRSRFYNGQKNGTGTTAVSPVTDKTPPKIGSKHEYFTSTFRTTSMKSLPTVPSITRDCETRSRTKSEVKTKILDWMIDQERNNLSLSMPDIHRVLIYTTCYNVIDGVTITIRKIEQEILASGGHVCIVTTKSGNISNTNLDGLSHPNRRVIFLDNSVPIPFMYDTNNPDAQYHLGYSLSSKIIRQIDEFDPSIIHITVPDCAGLCMIQYARDREIPLMGTYHSNIVDYIDHYPGMGWTKPILTGFFGHIYNFLQRVYVPTPFIRRHLCDDFHLHHCTDLGIWGRGIDLDKFSPKHRSQEFRRKLGIFPSEVVVCFVGRLVPEKRPDIFAHVIRRLHKEGIPFRALVVGAGPYQDEIRMLPNTIFAGWMSGKDLSLAYASSDIFLFPSSVETFGNVTLEAAASGLPLVVEAGCSGHLVRDGFNGYACKAGDKESFFNATASLILNREKRQKFAINSRDHSLAFEQHQVMKKMLSIYSDVTDEFYTRYGGCHYNRDEEWKGENSFVGGTEPRPYLLKFVVFFFIVMFQVSWLFLSGFYNFRDLLMRFVLWRLSTQIQEGSGGTSLFSRRAKVKFEEESNDGATEISINNVPYGLEYDDYNDFDESKSSFFVGDWNCAQTLATQFTRCVLSQWRVESVIVKFLRNCFRSSFNAKRKRKNSRVATYGAQGWSLCEQEDKENGLNDIGELEKRRSRRMFHL